MLVGGGEGCGGATVRVWDGHVHTAVFKKENNKDASLSITNSWSSLKLMPIELVMPSILTTVPLTRLRVC